MARRRNRRRQRRTRGGRRSHRPGRWPGATTSSRPSRALLPLPAASRRAPRPGGSVARGRGPPPGRRLPPAPGVRWRGRTRRPRVPAGSSGRRPRRRPSSARCSRCCFCCCCCCGCLPCGRCTSGRTNRSCRRSRGGWCGCWKERGAAARAPASGRSGASVAPAAVLPRLLARGGPPLRPPLSFGRFGPGRSVRRSRPRRSSAPNRAGQRPCPKPSPDRGGGRRASRRRRKTKSCGCRRFCGCRFASSFDVFLF
mmetsp:Transcript_106417/g.217074  ORF Transcript_106417/g.217074 Transcript_106417/m.217074 type:complete len:254 (+) Transcript_106417:340-1101(+)